MWKSTRQKKQINTTSFLFCTQSEELMPEPTWLAASGHEWMLGPRAWAPGLTVVGTLLRHRSGHRRGRSLGHRRLREPGTDVRGAGSGHRRGRSRAGNTATRIRAGAARALGTGDRVERAPAGTDVRGVGSGHRCGRSRAGNAATRVRAGAAWSLGHRRLRGAGTGVDARSLGHRRSRGPGTGAAARPAGSRRGHGARPPACARAAGSQRGRRHRRAPCAGSCADREEGEKREQRGWGGLPLPSFSASMRITDLRCRACRCRTRRRWGSAVAAARRCRTRRG